MKTTKMMAIVAVLAFGMVFGSAARAGVIDAFLGQPTGGTNTKTWAQLGYEFLSAPEGTKQVNRLGFWVSPLDSGGTGVLAANHTIGIYKLETLWILQAKGVVNAGASGDVNQWAWVSIPAVTLSASTYYAVTASAPGDYWGQNTAAPVVGQTFGAPPNRGRYSATGFPIVGVGMGLVTDSARHYGPNIGFAAPELPVPEPAGLGLMGLALLAVRRKRS